jgi:hypothetical protein
VMNSTGASSFPNYAVCSKLSTCSSCIEAEVIFKSAAAANLPPAAASRKI